MRYINFKLIFCFCYTIWCNKICLWSEPTCGVAAFSVSHVLLVNQSCFNKLSWRLIARYYILINYLIDLWQAVILHRYLWFLYLFTLTLNRLCYVCLVLGNLRFTLLIPHIRNLILVHTKLPYRLLVQIKQQLIRFFWTVICLFSWP